MLVRERSADEQEAGATRGKKGYIDLTTQKSGSIFTTRILRELSDQYLDLQKKYETLQNSLVKKVVEIAGTSLSISASSYHASPSRPLVIDPIAALPPLAPILLSLAIHVRMAHKLTTSDLLPAV